jgi:hypothetical protein
LSIGERRDRGPRATGRRRELPDLPSVVGLGLQCAQIHRRSHERSLSQWWAVPAGQEICSARTGVLTLENDCSLVKSRTTSCLVFLRPVTSHARSCRRGYQVLLAVSMVAVVTVVQIVRTPTRHRAAVE